MLNLSSVYQRTGTMRLFGSAILTVTENSVRFPENLMPLGAVWSSEIIGIVN